MNKILIETINLKKTYKHLNGNITLFNNLNLKIKQGDLVALVGPSGSGKVLIATFTCTLRRADKRRYKVE